MKIKINEYETYEIKLTDEKELSVQEAWVLAERLLKIVKAVSKDEIIMAGINQGLVSQKRTYTIRSNSKIWSKDRNETLKLLKLHYTASLDKKIAYAKENNVEWNYLCKKIYGLRKKWNIKPQEIGLTAFYTRGQFQPLYNKRNRQDTRPFTKSREIALQVLHIHFWGTDEQKLALSNQYGVEWQKITTAITNLRKKWKIEPKEIGLKRFPTKHNFGDFRRDKSKWKI